MPFGQGRSGGGGGRGRAGDKKPGDKEKGLPRKLALLATEGNKKVIEREKVKFDAKEAEEQKVAQAVADRLANVEVEIARKVGETDALFGSVTNADVAESLAGKGFDVDRRK